MALTARSYHQATIPAIPGLDHIQTPLVSVEWDNALQFHPAGAFVHYILTGI